MFRVINGVTCIDGKSGQYDNKINNDTVRYARNAVSNYINAYSPNNTDIFSQTTKAPKSPKLPKFHQGDNIFSRLMNKLAIKSSAKRVDKYINSVEKYISKFDEELESIPTPEFKLKYAETKNGIINPIAPVAAAYEEMGKKLSVKVSDLTKKLKNTVSPNVSHLISAKSLDLNKDGLIDIGEYASSIIVEDMLSTNYADVLKPSDVKGVITNNGQTALLSFANKNNYKSSLDIFRRVYSDFNLKQATREFLDDTNNVIQ